MISNEKQKVKKAREAEGGEGETTDAPTPNGKVCPFIDLPLSFCSCAVRDTVMANVDLYLREQGRGNKRGVSAGGDGEGEDGESPAKKAKGKGGRKKKGEKAAEVAAAADDGDGDGDGDDEEAVKAEPEEDMA